MSAPGAQAVVGRRLGRRSGGRGGGGGGAGRIRWLGLACFRELERAQTAAVAGSHSERPFISGAESADEMGLIGGRLIRTLSAACGGGAAARGCLPR